MRERSSAYHLSLTMLGAMACTSSHPGDLWGHGDHAQVTSPVEGAERDASISPDGSLVHPLDAGHSPDASSHHDAGAGHGGELGPPNIIFIIADDQRADNVSCMPKLQSLVGAKGVTFRNSFASTPLCCPGRTSVLTGKYAHNHGVTTNGDVEDGDVVVLSGNQKFNDLGNPDQVVTKWLRSAGYRTGFFGKYLNGYDALVHGDADGDGRPDEHLPPHWDEWAGLTFPTYFNFVLLERSLGATDATRVCYLNATGNTRELADRCVEAAERVDAGGENYLTDVLAVKATDFVRRAARDGAPFFMYFAPKSAHSPYQSPARYQPNPENASFTALARRRLGECSLFDWKDRPASYFEDDLSDKPEWLNELPDPSETKLDARRRKQLVSSLATEDALEALLAVLDETGQRDNTVIIYTSDNGYAWGEHGWTKKNCAYEECSRVPLLAYDPRHPQGGRVLDAFALNVDMAPTFAELAGVELPDDGSIDGMSLAPLITGASDAWSRDRVLTECWGGASGPSTHASVRTAQWKYIEQYTDETRTRLKIRTDLTPEVELYDLISDPNELDNLLRVPPATIELHGHTPLEVLEVAAHLSHSLHALARE